MTPCSCAASSASQICRAIGSASFSGIGPCAIAIRERGSFDQLQHQRGNAVGVFEAVDGADVGMVERGEDLGLPSESRQAISVEREECGEDFDRDVTVQLAVPRAIHLAHSPSPNRAGNLIRPEPRPRCEWHRSGRRCHSGRRMVDARVGGHRLCQ